MKTRSLTLATLFTFGLLLSVTAITPSSNSDRYLPLATGIKWVMDARVITPDKKEFKGKGIRTIGATVERDGKKYYRVKTQMDIPGLPPLENTKLGRKDAQGYHSIVVGAEQEEEEVEIPLPLKIGAQWETKHPRRVKHTVLALETVKIGDKVYTDCFKIHSEGIDSNFSETFWEAPLLGSIKSEIETDGAKISLTLRSVTGVKEQEPER